MFAYHHQGIWPSCLAFCKKTCHRNTLEVLPSMVQSLFQSFLTSKSTSIFVHCSCLQINYLLINAVILGMDVPMLDEEKSQEVQPKYFQ